MASRKNRTIETIDEAVVEVSNEVKVEEETPVTITGVVVNCEMLNVRQAPDVNANVIGVISKGVDVTIVEGANDLFYKTTIGYVMKEFIELK